THLQFDGLGDRVRLTLLRLGGYTGSLDDLAELACAAVRNGWLIGIQFYDGIIDPKASQCSEDMLHRVYLDVPLCERGRAVRFRDIFDDRFDLRFAFKVHATEAHTSVGWSG